MDAVEIVRYFSLGTFRYIKIYKIKTFLCTTDTKLLRTVTDHKHIKEPRNPAKCFGDYLSSFFAEPATQPTFLLVATSHSILLTDIHGNITLPINVSYGRVRAMDYDFDTNRTCYVSEAKFLC